MENGNENVEIWKWKCRNLEIWRSGDLEYMEYGAGTAGNHSGEEHRYQGSSEAWFLGRKHSRSNNLLFSKAHAHVRLNALSAGLSPGSKKRLEAQAKIGTHSRFVRPCQASALLTWYTSDLWYTSLICAKLLTPICHYYWAAGDNPTNMSISSLGCQTTHMTMKTKHCHYVWMQFANHKNGEGTFMFAWRCHSPK